METERQNLLWLDLEMTGLNVAIDHIVEVAALVTDPTAGQKLSSVFHTIVYQPDDVLQLMGAWVKEQHTKSGLVDLIRQSKILLQDVDKQLATMISKHGPKNHFILCGNSIWQDRLFMQKYLPLSYEYLHYRMIDVTTIKQVVRTWYCGTEKAVFVKKDAHRAIDDIYESIEELLHYKKYFFK
ncbi:MAG TPA: oligoribonuclease [Patescibacteria group bacterium]|jgi:oligoribonuclease|nr:oligoribonuclease [Patescibacteria group bacterium]